MAELPPQPKWGWKIPCNEPGCDACLEGWKPVKLGTWGVEVGPPPLHPVFGEGKGEGWWLTSHRHPQSDYGVIWRAYCPEHSPAAIAWRDRLAEWKEARRSHGKEQSLLVRATGAVMSLVGIKVQEWVEANPRPLAPWEVA